MKERCENCKYFMAWQFKSHKRISEMEYHDGVCRRYPRAIAKDKDAWCGEYHPQDAKEGEDDNDNG